MSTLVSTYTGNYTSQTVTLPQTASISEKASVKLERVREEILKTQTFFAQIPESVSRSIEPIINEYAGPAEVQEAQLSQDLLHSFKNNNFKLSNFYLSFALIRKGMLFVEEFSKVKSPQSRDTEKTIFLAKVFLDKIHEQIASLSFAHSSVHEVSLSVEQTRILFSKLIEAMDQFTEEVVPLERRNSREECRKILSELRHEALLLPVRHLYAKYAQKKIS